MDEDEKTRLWLELEKLGVDEVRLRLETRRVYGEQRAPYVQEWLRRKDHVLSEERERTNAASQAEIAATASRAAEAAERAASAAERQALAAERAAQTAEAANRRATIALVIAAISVIVSIVIPLLQRH
jgi:CHASE3 domain sensor protein